MTLVLPVLIQQTSLPHPPDLLPPAMSTSFMVPPSAQPSQPCSHLRLQRPKLTINTQQNRTFGKGSSLRLETLSAISPTVRNTFQNAYETNRVQIVSTPVRLSHEGPETPTTPDPADGRTPSASSISSASTFSDSGVIPYKLSHTTASILINSPIPRMERQRFSISQSRPIFPTEKHVAFRSPLEEEIRTTKYVWKHSDLKSEENLSIDTTVTEGPSPEATITTISIAEALSTQESIDESCGTPSDPTESSSAFTASSLSSPPPSAIRLSFRPGRSRFKIRSPKIGEKRDSSSESDSDSCPETPVAGPRKRRREWVWTLGPIESGGGESQDSSHASTEETASSDLARVDGSTLGSLGEEQSSNYSDQTESTCGSSRNSSESNVESSVTSEESVQETERLTDTILHLHGTDSLHEEHQ